MARKPRPPKISYTLKVTEQGDVPRDPTLSKTSGLTFWVAPPSTPTTPPSGDTLIDDNGIQNFFDGNNPSGSGVIFQDDLGRQTLPG